MANFEAADRLKKLPPYLFKEIDRKKAEVKSRGVDIIDLGVGDPDLPTPPHIIDALKKAGPDRAKIRDAIENTKGYVGISGIYNIRPQDHNGLSMKDIVMIKATKGSWILID